MHVLTNFVCTVPL